MSEQKSEEVKKLDIPSQFNAIPTGKKCITSLPKHESDRYDTWYNYFLKVKPDILPDRKGPLQWIADHHEFIAKYITEFYVEPKFQPSTLRNHLEALANILLAIDKNKYKEVVRPFFNRGLTLQQIIDKANEDSLLTEKELRNFVTYEQLVAKRDELEKQFLATPKDLKINMFHMILAVNTYIPPLRHNWLNMSIYPPRKNSSGQVIKKPAIVGPPPDDALNYLWEEQPGQWTIVINHDKIEHKREQKNLERQMFRLNDEIEGVTNGHKLNDIINKSLEVYPRNYPLIGIKSNNEMGASGYDSALRSMFTPKKPTQNVLRKAYVNYWHSKNLSVGKLKEIADRMRHSIGVALGSYRKINISGPIPETQETKQSPIPELQTLPIVPPAEPRTLPIQTPTPPPPILPPREYFKPVNYAKKYRENHREEILKAQKEKYAKDPAAVLRYKLLYNLNRGLSTRPQQATIERYGLYQDPETGKWKSRQAAAE